MSRPRKLHVHYRVGKDTESSFAILDATLAHSGYESIVIEAIKQNANEVALVEDESLAEYVSRRLEEMDELGFDVFAAFLTKHAQYV